MQQFQKHSVLIQGGLRNLQALLRQIHTVVLIHNNVTDIHQPLAADANRRPFYIQLIGQVSA